MSALPVRHEYDSEKQLRRANTIDVRKPTPLSHKIFGQHTVFCQAKTKRGTRCHNPAVAGSLYCHVHASLRNGETERKDKRSRRAATAEHNVQTSGNRTRVAEPATNPLLHTLASLMTDSSPGTDRNTRPPKKKHATGTNAVADKSNGAAVRGTDDPFEALAAAVSAAAEAAEQTSTNGQPKRGKRHGPPDD